jgi:hypothetical protein
MATIDLEEFKELVGKTITEAALHDGQDLVLKFTDGTASKITTIPEDENYEGRWILAVDAV